MGRTCHFGLDEIAFFLFLLFSALALDRETWTLGSSPQGSGSLSPFLISFVKPTHGGDAHEYDEETNQT